MGWNGKVLREYLASMSLKRKRGVYDQPNLIFEIAKEDVRFGLPWGRVYAKVQVKEVNHQGNVVIIYLV